ncbi:MAG: 2-oxoglutarate dehydrogenase complex dihydrolipoyllysine-residue succinyltransferase [Mangrovibacterium sp.]
MIVEIKIPTPGESITEVELGKWLIEGGAIVRKGDEIAEVESDKATLTIIAEADGEISLLVEEGSRVSVGTVVCTIDTEKSYAQNETATNLEALPISEVAKNASETYETFTTSDDEKSALKITPVAKEMLHENNLSVEDLIQGLKRIGKKEVEMVLQGSDVLQSAVATIEREREEKREKMSPLRRKLSQRLVSVKNETAMLTTFNEVDMQAIMDLRQKHQSKFVEKHGFKLGFMSFFTKACAIAIKFHPAINSMIDGDEIISPNYIDIGIAVQTPKGLMVPIVRDSETKNIPTIEFEIKELAEKARNKKISLEELSGGTFTITNGGTFGSLLSTPIINPPQSAILGMHNIVDRPVAINGKVEIRPMMYIALSYDHRIIDGKDSVGFLVKVKELLEHPELLLSDGKELSKILLDI